MKICFDEKTLNNIFNNDALTAELCQSIGAVVDAELEKNDDEIDFDFVDECSNMLLEIQSGDGDIDYNRLLPVLNSESFINNTKKLARGGVIRFARIGLAAAIILTSALTANAAVGSITGKTIVERIISTASSPAEEQVQEPQTTKHEINNHIEFTDDVVEEEPVTEKSKIEYVPETEKSSVVYEEDVTKPTTVKHESINTGTEEQTTTQPPIVTGLDAVIIHSVFKTEYYVGEEFCTDGLYLVANYSDGTRKTLDISECTVSGFDSFSPTLCRVCIGYEGNSYIIDVTVKEQQTTKASESTDKNNETDPETSNEEDL